MTQTSNEIIEFYVRLIKENAQGIQKKVCDGNGISLNPTSVGDLCPIPVFEDTPASLLKSANIGRKRTELRWATNHNFEYLPAYYKRIRHPDGGLYNEIVVTTGNYCEARFFAAKELMHCFIDEDGYPATNSIALVNELIESLAVGAISLEQSPGQTIVDKVAWLGASEYLVPNTWVPLLVSIYKNISANFPRANAYLHVAQIIRVPENVLRLRIRDALKESTK